MQYHTHCIYTFGNPDLPIDSLPLRLLPALREALPNVTFETLDPNEEWNVPTHLYVLDTVVNLRELTVFHDLAVFMAAPRMTCHDFDAYANLMLMRKLGKVSDVTIIGLPPSRLEDVDTTALVRTLKTELGIEY